MREMLTIDRPMLEMCDLEQLEPYAHNAKEMYEAGYYQLLMALAAQFSGRLLVDAGTWFGLSAAAMAIDGRNRVVSYDVKEFGAHGRLENLKNVECRCEDVLQADWPIIYSSSLIFLDIDPHDGKKEKRFVERLFDLRYEGAVLCDDIHLNRGMKKFWGWTKFRVPWRYDLTAVGHSTGTGLLCFSTSAIVDL